MEGPKRRWFKPSRMTKAEEVNKLGYYLEQKEKREIRRKASREIELENGIRMDGYYKDLKDIKDRKEELDRELRVIQREEEEVESFFYSNGRMQVVENVRSKSGRKRARSSLKLKLKVQLSELKLRACVLREKRVKLREKHDTKMKELYEVRKLDNIRRQIEVQEREEWEREEKRFLKGCEINEGMDERIEEEETRRRVMTSTLIRGRTMRVTGGRAYRRSKREKERGDKIYTSARFWMRGYEEESTENWIVVVEGTNVRDLLRILLPRCSREDVSPVWEIVRDVGSLNLRGEEEELD